MPGKTNPRYLAVDGFKLCNACEQTKPVEEYYSRKEAPDGLRNDCKECISARGRERYEVTQPQQIAYARKWYRENREKALAVHRDWYERKGRERSRLRRESMTPEERAELNRQQREARAADPKRFRRYDLKRRLRRLGATIEQYEALMEHQGGVCAICKGPPSGKDDIYHVDHDHETGALRGLLCHYCNTSLGGFKDDVVALQRAIEYLIEPPFQGLTPKLPARPRQRG